MLASPPGRSLPFNNNSITLPPRSTVNADWSIVGFPEKLKSASIPSASPATAKPAVRSNGSSAATGPVTTFKSVTTISVSAVSSSQRRRPPINRKPSTDSSFMVTGASFSGRGSAASITSSGVSAENSQFTEPSLRVIKVASKPSKTTSPITIFCRSNKGSNPMLTSAESIDKNLRGSKPSGLLNSTRPSSTAQHGKTLNERSPSIVTSRPVLDSITASISAL